MLQPKNRVAEWIQKQDPYIWYLQEIHSRSKDTHIEKDGGEKRHCMQMETKS